MLGKWLLVAVLFLVVLGGPGNATSESLEFSFWGNLPGLARKIGSFESRTVPTPLQDPEKLALCRVELDGSLVLIRNGVLAGQGRVGEVLAGLTCRANDDRTAFFLPKDLPDSISVESLLPFPEFDNGNFDLYVLGAASVRIVEISDRRPVPASDFRNITADVLDKKVLSLLEISSNTPWEYSRQAPPPNLDDVVDWLLPKYGPVEFEITVADSTSITMIQCGSKFIRLDAEGMEGPVYLSGSLDYFLEIDGGTYMVMRDWKYGTGAWAYLVFQLHPNAKPQIIYSDGSWSN